MVPGYAVQGYSRSLILVPCNRKRVYDFLLVRNSNLGPILHRFGDIAGFYCAPEWPQPCFTLILGVFTLHQVAHVGVSQSRGLKLFGREIIFEEFRPMWSRYDFFMWYVIPERHTPTEDRNTALCTKVHRAVKINDTFVDISLYHDRLIMKF